MSAPRVMVVMPIQNEAEFIARSLGAVLAQDYPADRLDVVLADGMSVDGTREIVRSIAEVHRNVHLVDNPGRIVSKGLNTALREIRADIVVRVDGHCEIATDYVSRCVAHLVGGEAEGVGGPVETVGETPLASAIAIAMSSRFGVGDSAFRTRREGNAYVDTIAFPAYRRILLESHGPFDEELVRNQDDEYNFRLRANGARLLLAEDVRSRYYSRSTYRSLWRQYFQYGYWKVRVIQKHAAQLRWRHLVPAVFVASLAVSLALLPVRPVGWRALAIFAGLYSAGIALALFSSRARLSARQAPLVALAFPVMHVAYGAGFWTGLVRFWNRWGASGRRSRVSGSRAQSEA